MIVQAADRFHVPPWELLAQGTAWVEMAKVALVGERKAANEIASRNARRQRMQQQMSGGGRGRR